MSPEDDVSLNEDGDEVAVFPDFFEVELEEVVARFDDRCPSFSFIFWDSCIASPLAMRHMGGQEPMTTIFL